MAEEFVFPYFTREGNAPVPKEIRVTAETYEEALEIAYQEISGDMS